MIPPPMGMPCLTNIWTNYSVQAQVQFPVGAYGGGVGGRLDPLTGARYAAWIYPEGSPGGSNLLKLLKFQTWSSFGYNGTNLVSLQEASLGAVGTNWHTLKLAMLGQQLAVYYDGSRALSATDTEAVPYRAAASAWKCGQRRRRMFGRFKTRRSSRRRPP